MTSKYDFEVNAAVGIGFGANVTFENCIFDGNGFVESSVLIFHHFGKGKVKNSTIKNAYGTLINSGAVAEFEDSIFESLEIGIICTGNAMLSMKNCSFKNNGSGVAVMEEGVTSVSNCRFMNHSGAAIFIKDQAKGTFENNEIIDTKQFGILVRSEEPIVFRSNKLKNNATDWLIECSGKQLQRIDNEPNE